MDTLPVQLDLELCKACGICIELCPDKVFDRDKFGYPVLARPEECSQCLLCELHCPDFAIEVRRRKRKSTGKPAAGGAPAGQEPVLTQDDLIAATSGAPGAACGHHDEEG